ncbi:hypothetical protein F443_22792, partial [Phytophthora nicotianae P1569]
MVEREFPSKRVSVVEHELPHMKSKSTVERVFTSHCELKVEHGFPSPIENVVEHVSLPRDDGAEESGVHPRITGVIERGLSHLEGGKSSSSDSTTSSSSSVSKRKKKSKRRRLQPRLTDTISPSTTESVSVIEYVEGAPNRQRTIAVANPPSDAPSLTCLPGLSWKHFLRDLKVGEIEQVCLITEREEVDGVNVVSERGDSRRPAHAEPKSAREERFAAQSWEALKASGNPAYKLVREYADVFPDKIPAELPADRGVHHEIDLAPGTKYCVTRQWPLPRDQVKAIDEFFES